MRVTQAHEIITGIRAVKLNAREELWLGNCQVTRTKVRREEKRREDLHTMVLSALCSLLSAFCCVPIANTHANVALFLSLLSLLSLREGTQRPRVYDDH